jgi:hypothetical protein
MRGWIVFFLITAASGCGDPLGRQPLIGAVTLKGEPLDQGSILFLPTSPEQSSSGATIQQGTFQVPREKGLAPGVYKVVISSQEATGESILGKPSAGIPSRPVMRERIPASHGPQGNATVEVRSGAENRFLFEFD